MSQFQDFPPFYTLQLNAGTRARQLASWAELLRANHLDFVIEITGPRKPVMFSNPKINRELNSEFILALCGYLVDEGLGEWQTPNSQFLFYRRPINDWASAVHSWATKTGKIYSIESAFSVIHGDDSKGEIFHGIPNEIAFHALRALEKMNKCELIFRSSDATRDIMTCGVKFFS